MAGHNELGQEGEKLALDHLITKGHKLLEKNYYLGRNEIDLITEDNGVIVFTEVKARSTNFFGNPQVFVTRAKQQTMIRVADYYMRKFKPDAEARFDIVSIVKVRGQIHLEHIEDAFYSF